MRYVRLMGIVLEKMSQRFFVCSKRQNNKESDENEKLRRRNKSRIPDTN